MARGTPPKSGAAKKPNKAAQAALREAVDSLPTIGDDGKAFFDGFTPWSSGDPDAPAPIDYSKRPTEYSIAVVEEICNRIANGEVLKHIFADPAMPCRKTFYNWRQEHPEAKAAYLAAKEVQVEAYVEETIDISDERVYSAEQASRNKLRVSARQWYAEKLVPKQYGQKIGIGGAEGLGPIKTESQVDVDLTLTPAEAYKRMAGG